MRTQNNNNIEDTHDPVQQKIVIISLLSLFKLWSIKLQNTEFWSESTTYTLKIE